MDNQIDLLGHTFTLSPARTIYWPDKKILLLSDLHLGKINHFRRAGIAVPPKPNNQNLERLIDTINELKPTHVIFLGDLFHSHYNDEWEAFGQVIKNYKTISFELVVGNHDIMSDYQYLKHHLVIHKNILKIDNFIFSHEPLDEVPEGSYNLAGHIHPGVVLRGKGRQGMRLPCFWFGKDSGLLPAFGIFTGLARLRPKKGDQVFVILENRVINVS